MNQPSINTRKRPVVMQLLPSLHSGGVERGTLEVARGLVQEGWHSLVVSSGGPMVSQLEAAGSKHITLPVNRKSPLAIACNAQKLAALIRQHKVDVVHARSRAPAWAAWLAAKQTQTPFITTFHGFYGLRGMKKHYNKVMTYGRPTIAVSDFIRQHILKHYSGITAEDIAVIHSGVDTQLFRPENASAEVLQKLQREWGITEEKPVIFLPGRLTRWKGQHILLDALAKLKGKSFTCILAGDTSRHPQYVAEIQQKIRNEGLEDAVKLVPATPHMVEAYALADLVVVPSTDPEAFGRIPAEAQAMGKPVIASNHGGACETVKDGVTGWHVPPSDPNALKDAIEQVLALPNKRKQAMGKQARRYMQENFDTSIVCSRTLHFYRQAMKRNRSAVPKAA